MWTPDENSYYCELYWAFVAARMDFEKSEMRYFYAEARKIRRVPKRVHYDIGA
jgi:hypothetical protein